MHHLDDPSLTDWRHTLGQVWRIATGRRWWFVFPCCIVATIALVASHWLPRRYDATATFERRNDVVLQTLIGPAWSQAFEAQRKSLDYDLRGSKALAAALESTEYARQWPRDANCQLTPAGTVLRDELARRVREGLELRTLESNAQRDLVQIIMSDRDPALARAMVCCIRDQYIERARERMTSLLQDTLDYFHREHDRSETQVREAEARLAGLEREFPALSGDYSGVASAEANALAYERADLIRRIAESQAGEDAASRQWTRAASQPSRPTPLLAAAQDPRRAEIEAEVKRLRQAIEDEKVLRGKTDQHPAVRALRDKLAGVEAAVRALPGPRTAPAVMDASNEMLAAEHERLDGVVTSNRATRRSASERLAVVESRLKDMDTERRGGLAKRPEFAAARQELEQVRAESAVWQHQIEPMQRLLAAQSRDRGVRFIKVDDPGAVTRPSSPDPRMTVLACLALGVAAGAISVLLAELLDRSFRTASQVARSLGLPVLESVDEITTLVTRRRRLVRDLVILPGVTLLLAATMLIAGASAYLSIDQPELHRRLWAGQLSSSIGSRTAEHATQIGFATPDDSRGHSTIGAELSTRSIYN